jgi:hypothetical protein
MSSILSERKERAEATGDLMDMLNHLRLATYAVSIRDLPSQARLFHHEMTGAHTSGKPGDHPFMHAGVQFAEVSSVLHHRLKLASVWLRIEHDPRLAAGDVTHLLDTQDRETSFASSQGLYSGIYMLDAYISPLLACLTPGVWAIAVQRTFGSLLFSLGRPILGTSGDAVEPLQLVGVPGAVEAVQMPQLRQSSSLAAVQVWVEWLDQMFGVLSDLSVFTDSGRNYHAASHLQSMLTVEQVFRRMASLLVAHRDTNARRALAFTVLDSLEAVTSVQFDRMCTLSYAEQTLQRIEGTVGGEAGDVLLPAARRGVQALSDMQGGFFIAKQLKLSGIPIADGKPNLSLELAVAQYLKLLRDATHGHGAIAAKKVEPTNRLLAHHTGEVPHDIGLLAYLYLLDMLIQPDRLRRVLAQQSKRSRGAVRRADARHP